VKIFTGAYIISNAGRTDPKIDVVCEAHRKFLADPRQYTTYNDPTTTHDDTLNTFMTVAYVFCELAEQRSDYRAPLKRMMHGVQ